MKKFLKALPFIFLLSFVVTCVSMNVFAEETSIELGDVNSDGQINASDALAVLKHAAKISTVDAALADINKNGTVDATDALWILKYAARLISDFSDETLNATPVPTATPVPASENIKKVKNEIKANGYKEDTVYYIPYSVSENDTLYAFIVYYSDEDVLQLELSYYEEFSATEASSAGLFMPVTGETTEAYFSVGYSYGDYYEYFDAKASINPAMVTKNSKITYAKVDSYGVDDAETAQILSEAETLTKDSLLLWNDILIDETGLGLKDLGFVKY